MQKNLERVTPQAGAMVKQEFGGSSMSMSGSLAAEASIAAVQAQIQARYIMAMRNPRDWDRVRQKIKVACDRPGFAEEAIYTLTWAKDKEGNPVQGLSIRFAEEAMRDMGNLFPQMRVIFEDSEKRIISVSVTELESNVTLEKEVSIEKTVERNYVKEGQVVVGERVNTSGKKVYRVVASEAELTSKQAAIESKVMRTHLLRMLPGDIQAEAWKWLEAAARNQAAADPSGTKKKVLDAFLERGITADEVKNYIGHSLDQLTPKEIVDLQRIYVGVRDNDITWADALENKVSARAATKVVEQPAEAKPVEKQPEISQEPKVEEPKKEEPKVVEPPKPTPPPAPSVTGRADIMEAFKQLAMAKAKSPRLLATICAQLLVGADLEMSNAVKAEFRRLSEQVAK